jgi:hypothetical protein
MQLTPEERPMFNPNTAYASTTGPDTKDEALDITGVLSVATSLIGLGTVSVLSLLRIVGFVG